VCKYAIFQIFGVTSLQSCDKQIQTCVFIWQVKDVAILKEKIVKGDKGETRKEYEVVAVC